MSWSSNDDVAVLGSTPGNATIMLFAVKLLKFRLPPSRNLLSFILPFATYEWTVSGAKTEILWLDAGPRASTSTLFVHSLHGFGAAPGDISEFNTDLTNCVAGTTGVFNLKKDADDKYICSSKVTPTISGPVVAGDKLRLTITDPDLAPSHFIDVVAIAGDTTTTFAQRFVTAINADATFSAAKITATVSAAPTNGFNVIVKSGNQWTYTFTKIIGGETLGSPVVQYGRNDSFSQHNAYNPADSHWDNLTLRAWPDFFVHDKEVFAEKFAAQFGGTTDRTIPPSTINPTSQDWYLQQPAADFSCAWNFIQRVGQTRMLPTSFPAGCPTS